MTKRTKVRRDRISRGIATNFEIDFSGVSSFTAPDMAPIPKGFGLGLIVGPSGSGKSTLLEQFGTEEVPYWARNRAIASHFNSIEDAQNRLSAVGFGSVPSWLRPFEVLSTGEKFRANLARTLSDNAVIDEFTSVVDRTVAKSCANAVNRYIRKEGLRGLIFASCHYDIIEWLQPDWVFDTATGAYAPRGCLRRPDITLEILPCGVEAWSMFRQHHYLTEKINKSAKHWLAIWGEVAVGFASAISFPSGTVKKAYRGHRTVVSPDYQGLGIGVRLSDAVAEIHIQEGKRYFSKTAHPRMGGYRNQSPLWKPTSKNMRKRKDKGKKHLGTWVPREVVSFSHEYIGQ